MTVVMSEGEQVLDIKIKNNSVIVIMTLSVIESFISIQFRSLHENLNLNYKLFTHIIQN